MSCMAPPSGPVAGDKVVRGRPSTCICQNAAKRHLDQEQGHASELRSLAERGRLTTQTEHPLNRQLLWSRRPFSDRRLSTCAMSVATDASVGGPLRTQSKGNIMIVHQSRVCHRLFIALQPSALWLCNAACVSCEPWVAQALMLDVDLLPIRAAGCSSSAVAVQRSANVLPKLGPG